MAILGINFREEIIFSLLGSLILIIFHNIVFYTSTGKKTKPGLSSSGPVPFPLLPSRLGFL